MIIKIDLPKEKIIEEGHMLNMVSVAALVEKDGCKMLQDHTLAVSSCKQTLCSSVLSYLDLKFSLCFFFFPSKFPAKIELKMFYCEWPQ